MHPRDTVRNSECIGKWKLNLYAEKMPENMYTRIARKWGIARKYVYTSFMDSEKVGDNEKVL